METERPVIHIPEKNCVNCGHFAWWDGDFCCTKHLKILQEAPTYEFNDDIIRSVLNNKDCTDWEKCEENFLGRKNGIFYDRFVAFLISKIHKDGDEQTENGED